MTTERSDYFADLLDRLEGLEEQQVWTSLEKAALEHPDDPRPLVVLAAGLMSAGKVDLAEAVYTTALQCAPTFALARFQLGLLQWTSARPAVAMATWAPLERLGDSDPLCLFKRGLEAVTFDRFADGRRWLLAGMAANTTNEPLNRDMQLVLDRLLAAGLVREHQAADAAVKPAEVRETTSEPTPPSGHVLLSGYGRKS